MRHPLDHPTLGLHEELLHSLDAIVWEADADPLAFTFVSDHATSMLGYPPERWLDGADFWVDRVHPEDRERVVRECTEATRAGRDHALEYRFIAADDRVVWLRDVVRVLRDEDGRPTRLRGVMIDITEQRATTALMQRAEARFALSFEHSPVAMVLWSVTEPDGLIDVNAAMCELLGYRREQLCAMGPTAIIHPADRQAARTVRRLLMSDGAGEVREVELRGLRADGETIWVAMTSAVVRDAEGTPAHGISFVVDITDRRRRALSLQESERMLEAQYQGIPVPLFTFRVTPGGDFVLESYNRAASEASDGEVAAFVGRTAAEIHAGRPEELAGFAEAWARRAPVQREITYTLPASGRTRELIVTYVPTGEDRMTVHALDVTEQRALVQRLAESNRLHRSVVRAAEEGLWMVDANERTTFVNEQLAAMLGYREEDLLGRPHDDFLVDPDPEATAQRLAARRRGESERYETALRHRDGGVVPVLMRARPITDDEGRFAGSLALCYDLRGRDQQREFTEAVLASVGEGIYVVDAEGRLTYLNPAGERLLGYTAAELAGANMHDAIHAQDRHGNHVPAERCSLRGARRGGEPVRADDEVFRRKDGSLLPVAISSSPVTLPDGRRGAVLAFRDISERKAAERSISAQLEDLDWLARIRGALNTDGFVLYRQPVVTLPGREVVAHELLLRMIGDDGAAIAPGAFLPVAEQYGLITEIDRWVFRQAARLVAASGERVSLNLSARSVADPGLLGDVARLLEDSGADPALITVELTETAFMEDQQRGIAFARGLSDLGCRLALDDFGTGYGTFTYLKHLPVHALKIDREFVSDLTGSPASRHVVRAVVSLAQAFGHATVAEGVENEETLAVLAELGVDQAQGYLLGRPAPGA